MTSTAIAQRADTDAHNDRLFRWLLAATVVFVLLALGSPALSMLWGGRHALEIAGLDFFLSSEWNPVANRFGALVQIYGTTAPALIAMLVAVPVSNGIDVVLAKRWKQRGVG